MYAVLACGTLCGCVSGQSSRETPITSNTSGAVQVDTVQKSRSVRLCTIRGGELVQFDVPLDSVPVNDTLNEVQPHQDPHTDEQSPFARTRSWFQNDAPVALGGRTFYKNSPPIKFIPEDLLVVGSFDNTLLFVEKGAGTDNPSILFVLVDATCQFQGYYFFN